MKTLVAIAFFSFCLSAISASYSGDIHTIWFNSEGILPVQAIANLKSWALEVESEDLDYRVHLWTEVDRLEENTRQELLNANVVIDDVYSLTGEPIEKIRDLIFSGHWSRDKFYYAVASDILRVELLRYLEKNKLFLYADIGDTVFISLASNLKKLHLKHINNQPPFQNWSGFTLPYMAFDVPNKNILANKNLLDFNNDLIIAIRDGQTSGQIDAFLNDYLTKTLGALDEFDKNAYGGNEIFNLVLKTSNPSHAFLDAGEPFKKRLQSWPEPLMIPNSYDIIEVSGTHTLSWVPKRSMEVQVRKPSLFCCFRRLPAISFNRKDIERKLLPLGLELSDEVNTRLKSIESLITEINLYRKKRAIENFYRPMLGNIERIREIALQLEKIINAQNPQGAKKVKNAIIGWISPLRIELHRLMPDRY